jgi:hypothetical protein
MTLATAHHRAYCHTATRQQLRIEVPPMLRTPGSAADRVERHRYGAGPWPCPTWSVGRCELAAGERTSVYLGADLAAAVKASGQPLVELIRRGLTAGTAEVAQQPARVRPSLPSARSLPASRAPEYCAWDRGAGSATRGSSASAAPALPRLRCRPPGAGVRPARCRAGPGRRRHRSLTWHRRGTIGP